MRLYRDYLKRFFDFWIALIALICVSPLLLVVAIWLGFANRLTPNPGLTPNPSPEGEGNVNSEGNINSGGSFKRERSGCFLKRWFDRVFFLQERPGKDEKLFNIIKFKSMTDERDSQGNLLPNELRITKVGKFVRKTSIDELPQLFNVLKGEMALIGPRPLFPEYLPYYTERERLRHTVRPGISGWAQVNGRNAVSWNERLELDAYYVEHLSLFMDCKVILKTIKNVLVHKDVEVVPTGILLNIERHDKVKKDSEK